MEITRFTPQDSGFPEKLRRIADPPAQLLVQGRPLDELLSRPCLAVVGSRAVSPYGQQVTEMLVEAAARAGVVIISGLALGVDSIAHRSALRAEGATIAVLPGSLEQIYPASHYGLARQILTSGGTLVSEYQEQGMPHKHQFIARNRLIAGLASAVLITEAAERSGSLHTAQFALEDGKDVLAVPGNITSQGSKGVNNLIKMGAIPVTSTEDLLAYFGIKTVTKTSQHLNPEEQTIINLLKKGVTSSSQLLIDSQLPASRFNQILTMLEITNQVKPVGAGHWRLI